MYIAQEPGNPMYYNLLIKSMIYKYRINLSYRHDNCNKEAVQ